MVILDCQLIGLRNAQEADQGKSSRPYLKNKLKAKGLETCLKW
jgi:hypothetical protein